MDIFEKPEVRQFAKVVSKLSRKDAEGFRRLYKELQSTPELAPLREAVMKMCNEITGTELRQRTYSEHITVGSPALLVSAGVDLAIAGLAAALGYIKLLNTPKGVEQQEKMMAELFRNAQKKWETEPSAVVIRSYVFQEIQFNALHCQGCARQTMDPEKPQVNFDLRLTFIHQGKGRLDVLVRPLREKSRPVTNRTVRRLLRRFTHARVYYPQNALSDQLWVNDAVAMLLIYLAQRQFIDFDSDEETKTWLLNYLDGYRDVRKATALTVLGELLKNFIVPQDYRAFRKYVARTAYGLSKMESIKRVRSVDAPDSDLNAYDETPLAIQESLRSHAMPRFQTDSRKSVPEMAQLLGVSERRVYELIQRGTLKITERSKKDPYLLIDEEEAQRVCEKFKQKRLKKSLIEQLAASKNIGPSSAWRWVRRQEQKGLALNEILTKLLMKQRRLNKEIEHH